MQEVAELSSEGSDECEVLSYTSEESMDGPEEHHWLYFRWRIR